MDRLISPTGSPGVPAGLLADLVLEFGTGGAGGRKAAKKGKAKKGKAKMRPKRKR